MKDLFQSFYYRSFELPTVPVFIFVTRLFVFGHIKNSVIITFTCLIILSVVYALLVSDSLKCYFAGQLLVNQHREKKTELKFIKY